MAEEETESYGISARENHHLQSTLPGHMDERNKKLYKKKQGLFKGLGSVFR